MIETVISGRQRSIGAMVVRRVLPYSKRRSVGPFVFVDDFGPLEIVSDRTMDILPHPHIGLATVTFLFRGQITHRDSIGSVQVIHPGDVNWMTAGSGVVHSERVSDSGNRPGDKLAGLQTWVALPEEFEETAPSFSHTGNEELPVVEAGGISLRTILGSLFGASSPVNSLGSPFYAECRAKPRATLELSPEHEERAAYVLSGSVSVGAGAFGPGELIVFKEGKKAEIISQEESLFMLLGGPRLSRQRYMYWNFVSTSRDRIEAAKDDWANRRFDPIPGESGFIPLP